MTLKNSDRRVGETMPEPVGEHKVKLPDPPVEASEIHMCSNEQDLAERIYRIAEYLAAQAGPCKRAVDKDEVDALWGHFR